MVDVPVLVREHLLTQAAVTALLGTNANSSIYAAPDMPQTFDAAKGPAIQIIRAGGLTHPEILELVEARIQLRVWADQQKYQLVSDVYGAVHDALHGLNGISLTDGTILSATEVTGPQEMTDPDTSWVTINSFYQVMARPN
jgi:hypothetical protein